MHVTGFSQSFVMKIMVPKNENASQENSSLQLLSIKNAKLLYIFESEAESLQNNQYFKQQTI